MSFIRQMISNSIFICTVFSTVSALADTPLTLEALYDDKIQWTIKIEAQSCKVFFSGKNKLQEKPAQIEDCDLFKREVAATIRELSSLKKDKISNSPLHEPLYRFVSLGKKKLGIDFIFAELCRGYSQDTCVKNDLRPSQQLVLRLREIAGKYLVKHP